VAKEPLFAGLVVDECGDLVETSSIGGEPCYVVNDEGFMRHIPAEQVDRQVLQAMLEQIKGHEDELADQTAKMLGQEDIFSRAAINQQIRNIDQQLEQVFRDGIPEAGRAYMGMMGFKVVINYHGEVIQVIQPSRPAEDDE
jgi:hypothetical protein